MSRADYAHWNEEADRIWWQEEGRFADEPREPLDDEDVLYHDRDVDDDEDDE